MEISGKETTIQTIRVRCTINPTCRGNVYTNYQGIIILLHQTLLVLDAVILLHQTLLVSDAFYQERISNHISSF